MRGVRTLSVEKAAACFFHKSRALRKLPGFDYGYYTTGTVLHISAAISRLRVLLGAQPELRGAVQRSEDCLPLPVHVTVRARCQKTRARVLTAQYLCNLHAAHWD
eukprot:IDg1891t1